MCKLSLAYMVMKYTLNEVIKTDLFGYTNV